MHASFPAYPLKQIHIVIFDVCRAYLNAHHDHSKNNVVDPAAAAAEVGLAVAADPKSSFKYLSEYSICIYVIQMIKKVFDFTDVLMPGSGYSPPSQKACV